MPCRLHTDLILQDSHYADRTSAGLVTSSTEQGSGKFSPSFLFFILNSIYIISSCVHNDHVDIQINKCHSSVDGGFFLNCFRWVVKGKD